MISSFAYANDATALASSTATRRTTSPVSREASLKGLLHSCLATAMMIRQVVIVDEITLIHMRGGMSPADHARKKTNTPPRGSENNTVPIEASTLYRVNRDRPAPNRSRICEASSRSKK